MRIRVSTVPPLSLTKVWSSLNSLPSAATVSNLKHSLCTQIPALRGLRGDQIRLFVDDFELLDALPIDVVRENDIVHVKRVESSFPASVLRKRKRSESTSSSSSSSVSSSSPSSSSSSSPSESATDSSSDSDTSLTKGKAVKPLDEQPFVAPGMGKPATHSRNIRRRRKLQHGRSAATQDPDDPTAGVNAIPLGSRDRTDVLEVSPRTIVGDHGEFSDLTMESLSNKNKRKGFKNTMGKELPSKIIFSERVDPRTDMDGRVQVPAPRLVPPSEKQEKGLLPPNIFVTSVNVEEVLRRRKKSKSLVSDAKRLEIPPVGRTTEEVDRTAVEAKWDSLGLVSNAAGLPTGAIVGWKALGINPVTVTPEMILHVGAIVSCDETQVTVKFSDWTGFPAGTVEEAEEVEESYEWKDVVGQWRIVSV